METTFDELKRYVRLDAADAARLLAFRPLAAPHFDRIAREFYDRIREHEEAHAVFKDEAQIARLQRSLTRWLERLLSGRYDEAYFVETSKIGEVHVRVGLPQRYMFTAMALIRVALTRIAEDALGPDAGAVVRALTRLLDLELCIMLESYKDALIARVRRSEPDARVREGDDSPHQEGTLTETAAQYVHAVDHARFLVIGLDASGAIRLFNKHAEKVTGFARDEVLGMPFAAAILPADAHAEHAPSVAEVTAGRSKERAFDGTLSTRAGKRRDMRWHVVAVPRKSSEAVVSIVFGQDVTDEKRALASAAQDQRLAAVGTLAAGLAHEIRNPLNGAQLHVAYLERAIAKLAVGKVALPADQQEMLEAVHVIGDEVKRLARLVSDFLDFARPRPLDLATASIVRVARRAVDLCAPAALAASVMLTFDPPTEDVAILVDAARLEQLFLNLVQNAIDAAATSGGHVTVRVRREPHGVLIDIEDDGPGMPEGPVFDAFFSTKPSGTGLGLAIARRVVVDHHGSIDVESAPGKTCFRVRLPLQFDSPSDTTAE